MSVKSSSIEKLTLDLVLLGANGDRVRLCKKKKANVSTKWQQQQPHEQATYGHPSPR